MAKQTFTAGQVLTAAEMNSLQENDYNWTVTTKTASYTLAAGDEGTRIVMNNAGATTITVDDSVFSAGDVVWIHNIGAGTCTVTAGTATVNTAASLDLEQWEGGSLYFTSASSAIFFRGPAAGVGNANFTDTETGTYSSGGTNYKYLTFNASGTITVDTAGLCDILVVGGGGSGGQNFGGGGGAGGHLYATGAYLPVGTHTVTVGGGGAAVASLGSNLEGSNGYNGSPSAINDYIAPGGGGGGGARRTSSNRVGTAGNSGGSGGGSSGGVVSSTTGGTGLSLVGNDGGDGTTRAFDAGAGGGGGAGAAGGNATSGTATSGTGGNGLSNSITGSAVTRAGGGGGGAGNAAGGTGGGGAGNIYGNATSGTANTGGGGGGQSDQPGGTIVSSGAGGSGVVIVRVEV